MPKLAIIATIEIAPGRMDEYLPIAMAHRARCLKDEPGTLQLEILRPLDDSSKIMVYEVYEDETAFDAHWNGASIKRAREEAAGMVVKLVGTRCALME